MSNPMPTALIRKTLHKSWRNLFNRIIIKTEYLNDITVTKEFIPVIFIPGVMGTRLSNTIETVWDPDNTISFVKKFGLLPFFGSSARRTHFIGKGSYNSNRLFPTSSYCPLYSAENGWENVIESAYKALRICASQISFSPAASLCFEVPNYAFGYNWTANPDESGLLLAKFIKKAIRYHRQYGECNRVILITHSMGGLVARSASQLHGAESSILGIIHTVQPAAGAPIAYHRMKAGYVAKADGTHGIFDRLASWLLGRNGDEITATLGNMPGGLSLLPNHLYLGVDSDPAWLTMESSESVPPSALPQYGDPYGEIYRNQGHAWRLIDSSRLNPSSEDHHAEWQNYLVLLKSVEKFHRALGNSHHPRSYHIVGDSISTPTQAGYKASVAWRLPSYLGTLPQPSAKPPEDQIESLQDQRLTAMRMRYPWANFTASRHTDDRKRVALDLHALATPDGDGTVPVSSASSLVDDPTTCTRLPHLDHADAMNDPRVLTLIRNRISEMLHEVIYREAAKDAP